MMKTKFILGLFIMLGLKVSAQTYSLDFKYGWQFRQVGTETWYPATVPGTVHTDLFANDLIGDPFEDNNEIEQQWIEKENWEYKNVFSLDDEMYNYKHHEFNFEGLDTYADVYFNDSLILEANNMFRSWRINVDGMLKEDENVLRIVFTSPINKNDSIARNHIRLPAGGDTTAFPVGPFTRKAAYHFGWDFAPRFVTSGIWKNIQLQFWDEFVLRDVYHEIVSLNDTEAVIKTRIISESFKELNLTFLINNQAFNHTFKKGKSFRSFQFKIKNPKLWWPNGSGDPHLYSIETKFISPGSIDNYFQVDRQEVGLRTIELINEPDSIGTSFFFKVNDVPIFMKGANYVPQDVFLPRVKPEQYERIVKQIKDAGMNMLRVWGGGVYERDLFYNLCDEYGILVWQDFMFANSLYPSDSMFSNNIYLEAVEQVNRLSKHACLALFCGNNEIEVAWKNWGWQKQYGYSSEDSLTIWNDYIQLFNVNLESVTFLIGKNTPYVSTSPQSNWGTPENFNHGSMHYWGVWHGDDDFSGYEKNIGRFMAEWGFQSYPDYELLKKYISPEHLNLENNVMGNRQKSYVGNYKILEQVGKNPNYSSSIFPEFVKGSQVAQAAAYAKAIKAHLNAQPHCMGTLLWQLNDCWPGPSWSIINYDGVPKEAYDSVKKAFRK